MRTQLLVAAALLLPAAVAAQSSTSFVVIMGRDTIAIEQFSRSANQVTGELKTRGMGPRLKYSLDLADGMPTVLHNAAYSGDADSTLTQSAVLYFRGDSVIADITTKGLETKTERIKAAAGVFPFINPSFALFEPVLARARTLGGSSATLQLFTVSGGQTFPATVTWVSSDSAVVSIAGVDLRIATNARGEILGGSVPSQNLSIVRTRGPARMVESKADYSAPAGAAYTAQAVKIKGPSGTLAGTLTMPKKHKALVPVAITISGSGLEDRDEALPIVSGYKPFRDIAEALAAKGIAVLRYDDRGYGESTGNPAAATSEDFAADTRAVLTYLRSRGDVDSKNLFLIGHSEGGIIAPMVAAAEPGLRGIVLLAGTSRTGRRILQYQFRYGVDQLKNKTAQQRDSLYNASVAGIDSMAAKQPWVRFFADYDPLPTLRKVKTPILVLQGSTDRQVTMDQAQEIAEAARAGGNRDVSVHVLPNVNHLFLNDPNGSPAGYSSLKDRKVIPAALDLLTGWIVQHVKEGA